MPEAHVGDILGHVAPAQWHGLDEDMRRVEYMVVAIRVSLGRNHIKCVGSVVAVGPLLMRCRNIYTNIGWLTIANDIKLQPYTSE